MRWDRGHRSGDVVDQRGSGGGGGPAGAGVGILFWLLSRFGFKGVLIGGALLAVAYFVMPQSTGDQRAAVPDSAAKAAGADEAAAFVGFVLDDVQSTWQRIFAERGQRYVPAKLVLFTGSTRSGCGYGSAEAGPFYCPSDQRAYIDLSFYRELERRFGAPGDFAQAYVIAHEIGHHVQTLLGIEDRKRQLMRAGEAENAVSVRQELQADCYAGIWGHATKQRNILEAGDIDEGLRAAAAIGDDALQRQAQGEVHPESWTHGSSEQRTLWFKRGYEQGTLEACDTLATR